MRNMLAFLAALVLTFLGLGYYLDWYRLGTRPAGEGHRQVTIDINTVKIGKDLQKAEEQVKSKLNDSGTTSTGSGTSARMEPTWTEPGSKDGHRSTGNRVSGKAHPPAKGDDPFRTDINVPEFDKWLENR